MDGKFRTKIGLYGFNYLPTKFQKAVNCTLRISRKNFVSDDDLYTFNSGISLKTGLRLP